jgi:hypothetical protein
LWRAEKVELRGEELPLLAEGRRLDWMVVCGGEGPGCKGGAKPEALALASGE